MNWISVNDKLPKIGETVLAAYDIDIESAEFDDDHDPDWNAGVWKRSADKFDADPGWLKKTHGMTHWMRIEFPDGR